MTISSPHSGLNPSVRMAGGVSAFGSLAGGLVYGQYESHFYEDNLDGNVVITDVVDEFDQALASLDARAGVAWTWRGLTVSGGYEMANWFNLADRATYVDDIQEATYVPAAQDVLLEGLFLQLTYVR